MEIIPRTSKTGKTHYGIRFVDHLLIRRRVRGYGDRRLTEKLGERLETLAQRVAVNAPIGDLQEWVDSLDDKLRDRLVTWGMLDKTTQLVPDQASRALVKAPC